MPPTRANGKVCYIEIPATAVERVAEFYHKVFGWRIWRRGDGATAFDDTTGEVSGARVLGRPAMAEPGLLLYIMVDSVARSVEAVIALTRSPLRAAGRVCPLPAFDPRQSSIPPVV